MGTRLKIGLIVDGERVSKHLYELVEWADTTDSIWVSHLIVQERPEAENRRGSRLSRLFRKSPIAHATVVLWKIKARLESARVARMKVYRGHEDTHDIGQLVAGRIRVRPLVSKSGFIHRFSDEDLARVRQEELDVLIRGGSGILKGGILSSARLGILSFHHGDNRINRGGPAGFWEVYYRQERTGFIVQRLTEELDGGDVILRGYIPTQDTHLLNAAMLFTKSFYHLRSLLLQIAQTRQLPCAEMHYPYSGKLFVSPRLHELVIYLFKRVTRSVTARVRRALRYQERWGICFVRTDWRRAVLWRGMQVATPAGRFLADPFVATRDGRSCVFAEDFVYRTSKAHISVFELTDAGARELGIAVREDFHLSFPYLFEFDGTLFMCPESREARQIRIYECTEFPLRWKLAAVAMKEVVAVDTMIFHKEGLWWMLTSISRVEPHDCGSELYLFWATTPLSGDWHPHVRNPGSHRPAEGAERGAASG